MQKYPEVNFLNTTKEFLSERVLKNFLIFLVLLLLNSWQSQAQSVTNPTWISFQIGHHEYYGDFGNEVLSFDIGYDGVLGVSVDQYLNNHLDLEISATYGELDYQNFFSSPFINVQGILQFKPLTNRYSIDPFIGSGIGITRFRYARFANTGNGTALNIPLQAGVDVKLGNNVSATTSATYSRTFSNNIDGTDFGDMSHDDFIIYSLGIKIGLNKSKDSDGDGVPNSSDSCPDQYGKSFWGCPDLDGDGIIDQEDDCPTVAGRAGLDGCPDTDRDGIPDMRDKCPEVQGEFEYEGCPDSDRDSINDQIDMCPEQAGIADNDGCPLGTDPTSDADNDGIVDGKDKCPKNPGTASNSGCPAEIEVAEDKELTEEIKRELDTIAENLQFSAGNFDITSTTQTYLDRLAEIMLDDSALRLVIRGHTDNTGSPDENLELSLARANAVRDYLINKGIEKGRVFAFGYGETRPIASNETEEGRRQNRRVELNLYYN